MARQIYIDSDYTIQQWIDSQNTMSDYMGDLDNFREEFKLTQFGIDQYFSRKEPGIYRNGYVDSSFVTALNHVNDPMVAFLNSLFNGGTAKILANLLVDSATFRNLNISDSPGGTGNVFTHFYAADAFVGDSFERGDSIGSTGLINSYILPDSTNYLIPSFHFDLFVESGATFRNIVTRRSFDADSLDSAIFNHIDIFDSGHIQRLTQDSNGYVEITFVKIENVDNIDSALISKLIRTENLITDKLFIDSVNINRLHIKNDFVFDDVKFNGASKFLITDSASPDSANAPGVIYFGAYKLDSV